MEIHTRQRKKKKGEKNGEKKERELKKKKSSKRQLGCDGKKNSRRARNTIWKH